MRHASAAGLAHFILLSIDVQKHSGKDWAAFQEIQDEGDRLRHPRVTADWALRPVSPLQLSPPSGVPPIAVLASQASQTPARQAALVVRGAWPATSHPRDPVQPLLLATGVHRLTCPALDACRALQEPAPPCLALLTTCPRHPGRLERCQLTLWRLQQLLWLPQCSRRQRRRLRPPPSRQRAVRAAAPVTASRPAPLYNKLRSELLSPIYPTCITSTTASMATQSNWR